MKRKTTKFVFGALILALGVSYPNVSHAGSFWGWETVWEGAGRDGNGCMIHVVRQVYNVFGINIGAREITTVVACPEV
jgi:hypothetical protein